MTTEKILGAIRRLIAYYRRSAYPTLADDAPLRHMPTHDRCYTEMRDGTCWYAPLDDCRK